MSRSANPERGEAQLLIQGSTHLLRPSFENLVAAETEIGSLFALVDRASEGQITLSEITALLWNCIDGDAKPTREAVGQAVVSMGLVAATKPVRVILAEVLQGRM